MAAHSGPLKPHSGLEPVPLADGIATELILNSTIKERFRRIRY